MTEMLLFDKLGMKDKEAIRAFVKSNSRRFAKKFYYNPFVEEQAVVEYTIKEIMERLQEGVAVCVWDGPALKALGVVYTSTWDSRVLNKRIGKLALYDLLSEWEIRPFLQRIYTEAKKMGFDALFGRAEFEKMDLLQALMFNRAILGDVLLTLGKNLDVQQKARVSEATLPKTMSDLTFVDGTTADEERLGKITELSFTNSHYFNDPHIPLGRAENVYQEWLRNSLRGFADSVIVAEVKENPIGYITFRLKRLGGKRFGIIDLIAVDRNCRGRGIGKMLVMEGIKRSCSEADTLLVSTQISNLPAFRLYNSLGFKPALSEATFHVWFELQNKKTFLDSIT